MSRARLATLALAAALTGGCSARGAPEAVSLRLSERETPPPAWSARSFLVEAIYSDGSAGLVTRAVAWRSSDPAIATVDASGTVHGLRRGEATITATLDGASASLTVQVPAFRETGSFPVPISDPYVPVAMAIDRAGAATLLAYEPVFLGSILVLHAAPESPSRFTPSALLAGARPSLVANTTGGAVLRYEVGLDYGVALLQDGGLRGTATVSAGWAYGESLDDAGVAFVALSSGLARFDAAGPPSFVPTPFSGTLLSSAGARTMLVASGGSAAVLEPGGWGTTTSVGMFLPDDAVLKLHEDGTADLFAVDPHPLGSHEAFHVRFDGSAWSAPAPLTPLSALHGEGVAFGPGPTITVASLVTAWDVDRQTRLWVRRFDGLAWGDPVVVEDGDLDAAAPYRTLVDGTGRAIVLFERRAGGLWAWTSAFDGTPPALQSLSARSEVTLLPSAASLLPSGDLLLVGLALDASCRAVTYTYRP